jgi:hypothetical protein
MIFAHHNTSLYITTHDKLLVEEIKHSRIDFTSAFFFKHKGTSLRRVRMLTFALLAAAVASLVTSCGQQNKREREYTLYVTNRTKKRGNILCA